MNKTTEIGIEQKKTTWRISVIVNKIHRIRKKRPNKQYANCIIISFCYDKRERQKQVALFGDAALNGCETFDCAKEIGKHTRNIR